MNTATQTIGLPDLSGERPLAPEQIAAFQRDGHILLRGVLSSDEIAAYREAIKDATARLNRESRKLEDDVALKAGAAYEMEREGAVYCSR